MSDADKAFSDSQAGSQFVVDGPGLNMDKSEPTSEGGALNSGAESVEQASSESVQGGGTDFSQLQTTATDNIGNVLVSLGSFWQSTKAQAREKASQAILTAKE
jgi:hypothetical protein